MSLRHDYDLEKSKSLKPRFASAWRKHAVLFVRPSSFYHFLSPPPASLSSRFFTPATHPITACRDETTGSLCSSPPLFPPFPARKSLATRSHAKWNQTNKKKKLFVVQSKRRSFSDLEHTSPPSGRSRRHVEAECSIFSSDCPMLPRWQNISQLKFVFGLLQKPVSLLQAFDQRWRSD